VLWVCSSKAASANLQICFPKRTERSFFNSIPNIYGSLAVVTWAGAVSSSQKTYPIRYNPFHQVVTWSDVFAVADLVSLNHPRDPRDNNHYVNASGFLAVFVVAVVKQNKKNIAKQLVNQVGQLGICYPVLNPGPCDWKPDLCFQEITWLADKMPYSMKTCQKNCQKKRQKTCQTECQIECQRECQLKCQNVYVRVSAR
jgi:hypothetical protein